MLREILFLLAQTEKEKRLTYFGVILLFVIFFAFVIDSFSKGKTIPTKGPLKKLIIIVCLIIGIILVLLNFVYK